MTTEAQDLWNLIPICGCGDPEEVLTVIHWILESQNKHLPDPAIQFMHYMEAEGRGPLYWFALYMLQHLDLTEHGTSAWCGWLTKKGEVALALLNEHGCDPDKWSPRIDE